MALNDTKIAGLKELARRGEGGERDNARAILAKNNISWEEPAKARPNTQRHSDLEDTLKSAFGRQAQGRARRQPSDTFDTDPFFNAKLRIENVAGTFIATIIKGIALRVTGSQDLNRKIKYEGSFNRMLFHGHTEEQVRTINQKYTQHEVGITDAMLDAIRNYPI